MVAVLNTGSRTHEMGNPDNSRWYDPTAGHWLSEDPTGLMADANPFRYVANAPVNYIDPLGLAKTVQAATSVTGQGDANLQDSPGYTNLPVYNSNIGSTGGTFLAVRVTGSVKSLTQTDFQCEKLQVQVYFYILLNARTIALVAPQSFPLLKPNDALEEQFNESYGHEQRHVIGGLIQFAGVQSEIAAILATEETAASRLHFGNEQDALARIEKLNRMAAPKIYKLIYPGLVHQKNTTNFPTLKDIPFLIKHPRDQQNLVPVGGQFNQTQFDPAIKVDVNNTQLSGFGNPPPLTDRNGTIDPFKNDDWYMGPKGDELTTAAESSTLFAEHVPELNNQTYLNAFDSAAAGAIADKIPDNTPGN